MMKTMVRQFVPLQSVRSPPTEEEEVAETTCDELTIVPIPSPLAPLGGRRWRNVSEVEPRKKGGMGGRCFKIQFYFLIILLWFDW